MNKCGEVIIPMLLQCQQVPKLLIWDLGIPCLHLGNDTGSDCLVPPAFNSKLVDKKLYNKFYYFFGVITILLWISEKGFVGKAKCCEKMSNLKMTEADIFYLRKYYELWQLK